MFLYVADTLRRRAGSILDLDELVEEFSRYDRTHVLKWPRRFGLRMRLARLVLVGELMKSGDHSVFCALDAHEGRRGYTLTEWDAQSLVKELPSQAQLDAFVAERLAEPGPGKEQLPDGLHHLLHAPSVDELAHELGGSIGDPGVDVEITGALVYEAREWTTSISDPAFGPHLATIYNIVFLAATNPPGAFAAGGPDGIEVFEARGFSIAYRWFAVRHPTWRPVFFLLGLERDGLGPEQMTRILESVAVLGGIGAVPTVEVDSFDEVAPYAARAYPGFVVADEDLWIRVQQELTSDKVSGLALSAEELSLLSEIGTGSDSVACLPLFINGRAGSGKSTMLAYLFAAYLHRHLEIRPDCEVRYVTLNDNLLAPAFETVCGLLENEAGLARSLSEDECKTVEGSFISFRDLLVELLEPSDRMRFDDPRREIRYAQFARLFMGESAVRDTGDPRVGIRPYRGQRLCSAETAWFVIRTLVKGRAEPVVSVEEYRHLPASDRVVAEETFEWVTREIWRGWYQRITADRRFWDDQDIARAALETLNDPLSTVPPPEIGVLFCDESQDFSRLELRVLLQCSLLSRYDLRHIGTPALPFAFAGDPLQTINPTGFRWDRMQSAFHEEIIRGLSLEGRVRLNLQEFARNYRSDQKIVHFLNSVNLWRSVLFDLPELKPQEPWHCDDNAPPPWKLVIGETIHRDQVIQHLGDHPVVILPCDEGEKLEYIKNDPLLAAVYDGASEENPAQNVLTAAEAKGLEFPLVVLYGFGQEAPDALGELVVDAEPHGTPRLGRDRLSAEYFFNKLYVAASRAQRRLIVLDTPEGDRRLWEPFFSSETDQLVGAFDGRIHEGQLLKWRDTTRPMEAADPDSVLELSGQLDQRALGDVFFDEGRHGRKPVLLRLAAQNYRAVGLTLEAGRAESWALRFEGAYEPAARRFEERGEWEEAWQALWEGQCWTALAAWFREAPSARQARHGTERMLVDFQSSSPDSTEALKSFIEAATVLAGQGKIKGILSTQPHWQTVVSELADRLQRKRDRLDTDDLLSAVEVLDAFGSARFPNVLGLGGSIAFSLGDYSVAVDLWERDGAQDFADYFRAKAFDVGLPGGLAWLERRGLRDDILNVWRAQGEPIGEEWSAAVAPQLEHAGEGMRAAELYVDAGRPRDALRCVLAEVRSIDPGDFDLRDSVLELLVRVIELASPLHQISVVNAVLDDERLVSLDRDLLNAVTVRSLAPVPGLSDATKRLLGDASKYLLRREAWSGVVSPVLMGLALERSTGPLVATLQFYERYFDTTDSAVASLARERWLVTKRRQIGELTRQIAVADKELESTHETTARDRVLRDQGRRRQTVASYSRQLERRESEWRIESATLPSPEALAGRLSRQVPSALRSEPSSPPDDPGAVTAPPAPLSRFELTYFPGKARLRITDVESVDTWAVDLAGRTLGREQIGEGGHLVSEGEFRVSVDIEDETVRVGIRDLRTGEWTEQRYPKVPSET